MKKLLRKKADPPQQPAPPPTVQKSTSAPPPLFARFASSHSTGSTPSLPVISGPVPLAPRDSIHRQSGQHDGSPPKPSTPRLVAPPVQRNRVYEKQQPANDGRGDKPFHDLGQTPPQRGNPHAFHREPVQPFEARTPIDIDGLLPKPQKSIPEFRRREDSPRDAEPVPAFPDTPPTLVKSEGVPRKPRKPLSASPERKPSTPAPAPEPLPSGLNPPDRPQPRRKYSPLEAFGLVSGENSPAASTTTSSVNLPSQSLVSPPFNAHIL